jgi:tetratricopeptide (TPR) repeat protein
VYEKTRIGALFANSSKFKTSLGMYKEALLDAKESLEYYIPESYSSILMKVEEFQVCFYGREYKQANECIDAILKHSVSDLGEFRYSTYVYYYCCNLFALKKYKEAIRVLNKPLEIEKNKSSWNIGVRILKIMLFVELNKLDEASSGVESLRKYMERITKSEEIEVRMILIVKLLRELEKNDFEFDPKNTVAAKLLKTLATKNKPTSWEHFTPELIKFHEWVDTLESRKGN